MKEKIKLLFDANILSFDYQKVSSRGGIFFVTVNLLKEILKRDDIDLTLFANPSNILEVYKFKERHPEFSNVKIMNKCSFMCCVLGWLQYWKYSCRKIDKKDNLYKKIVRFFTLRILRFCNNTILNCKTFKRDITKFDAYFAPNEAPHKIIQEAPIKKFIMLHDIIPLTMKEYSFQLRLKDYWFTRLFNSLNKNDYYITNSEYTKQDFLKYSDNLDSEHMTVALLGANENFHPIKDEKVLQSARTKYNIPLDKKFVFSLCTLEPRKNVMFSVRNFIKFIQENEINDLIFVMGGGHWQEFLEQLKKDMTNFDEYKDRIIQTGYIEDEDLPKLYSACEIFVYPSLYEGFGMPILEAMQCGCACITSNVTSIPEVIGDAGIQVNPKSDDEMIEAYKKLYYDKGYANICREKAIERAKMFSWKKFSDIIIEKIKEVTI